MSPLPLIVEISADVCGVSVSDILGTHQKGDISQARALVARLARLLTAASYPQIAQQMHKSHSSVVNAFQRSCDLIRSDEQFRTRYVEAKTRCERALRRPTTIQSGDRS